MRIRDVECPVFIGTAFLGVPYRLRVRILLKSQKTPCNLVQRAIMSNKDTGAEGVAKGVTSTVGNLLGGVGRTAGTVVGAAGRGVGDTINSTTGTQAVGNGLKSVTDGVEGGAHSVSKGAEDLGQWKTS